MRLFGGGCLIAFTVLNAGIAQPASAAKLTDTEHTRIDEPRPPDLPSDAELEAAGAVIRRGGNVTRNIFDESDPRATNGLFPLPHPPPVPPQHTTHPTPPPFRWSAALC